MIWQQTVDGSIVNAHVGRPFIDDEFVALEPVGEA